MRGTEIQRAVHGPLDHLFVYHLLLQNTGLGPCLGTLRRLEMEDMLKLSFEKMISVLGFPGAENATKRHLKV